MNSRVTVLAMAAMMCVTNAVLAGSCSGSKKNDIVTTAVEAGSFKTLAAALETAGLVEALQGSGPFTVFAPTDEAFAKLPAGTVAQLLEPANRDRLTAILTYHVVPGKVTAEQVVTLSAAGTLNGQQADVKVDGGRVFIDNAQVIKTDIMCSNGVIHVIDRVLLPTDDTIVDVANSAGTFKTLTAALGAAGLAGALDGEGPFTVFAPTDEAFGNLPAGTVEMLLKPENRDKLVSILKYHVVSGRVFSTQAIKTPSAKTLQGEDITIRFASGRLMINDATVQIGDIDAKNGVIHVIDRVMMPPNMTTSQAPSDSARMIELAIDRGVPLFNAGQHKACAAVYEVAATSLLSLDHSLSQQQRSQLTAALSKMKNTHDAGDQAWIMRHALDEVYMSSVASAN